MRYVREKCEKGLDYLLPVGETLGTTDKAKTTSRKGVCFPREGFLSWYVNLKKQKKTVNCLLRTKMTSNLQLPASTLFLILKIPHKSSLQLFFLNFIIFNYGHVLCGYVHVCAGQRSWIS